MKRVIMAIGALFCAATLALANTVYVSLNSPSDGPGTAWSNAFHTIQGGVDAAAISDTVLVTNGTYLLSQKISVTGYKTVQSVNGADATIVDGQGVCRCFNLGSTCMAEGFTITGGFSSGFGGGARYGTYRNCIFRGNEAEQGGGAYGCELQSCTVVGNRALFDAGGVEECDLYNSIVYYNEALLGTNDNALLGKSDTCSHCCITPVPSGAGNISDAPALQSLRTPRLVISSPCIDAGSNESWMNTAFDIEGDPRISGGTVDMGGDEVVMGAQFGVLSVEILAEWTNAVAGQPLRFEADIEGDVQGFAWHWGDGSFENTDLCVCEHAFSSAGTYQVILTADNKSGSTSATATVSVVSAFTAYVSPAGNHVPPFGNWINAATNIQAAVDLCIPGGTVRVAEGDYASGARPMWGAVSNRVVVDRPVSLVADGSRENTRIFGSGTTNGVPVRCAVLCDGAMLSGFTLMDGWAHEGSSGAYFADQCGGGIWSASGGTVSNCLVRGNTAQSCGGGIAGGNVVDCEISMNWAEGDYGGGTAYARAQNCVLSGNHAVWGGGCGGSKLENCFVSENSSGYGGGCAECTAYDCVLSGNWAEEGGGGCADSDLRNCIVIGNVASGYGGGGCYSTIRNCTVVGNKTAGFGGGTHEAEVRNSIVYYNMAAMGSNNVDEGSCTYTCTVPDPGGCKGSDCHNITASPRLTGFRYPHIGTYSPCINAGTNADWMTSATDFDGEARIAGGTVDMGADEYDGSALTGDPQAGMLFESQNAVAGFPLRFQADCRGKVAWLAWIWDDGTTNSGGCFQEHAFSAPGDYAVRLRARNSEMLDVMTVTVHVVEGCTNYVSSSGSHTPPYGSWATAATDLQSAVDANPYAGGVVLVDSGTYSTGGKVAGTGIANRVAIDRPLTVRSVNGPGQTVIVGSGGTGAPVRCAYVGDRALLEGFTLIDGETEDDDLKRTLFLHGGGAWCESEGRIAHCEIRDCQACDTFGGVYQGYLSNVLIYSNDFYGAAYATLLNCTAADNSWDTLSCKLINSIVTKINGIKRGSLFPYVCTEEDAFGYGWLVADPLFVGGGDYHLQAASPCIDAGTNLAGVASGLDGVPRPLDGNNDGDNTVDIGCYEFVNANADSDGDAMPDGWEVDHGLNAVADDSTGNPDGDPYSNIEEYIADTDPGDPGDWFHITDFSAGATAKVWFNSSDKCRYTLLGCDNLLSNNWTAFSSRTPPGGLYSMTDFTNTVPTRFYRVRVEREPL